MDQSNSNSYGAYGAPPPYNYQDNREHACTGVSYQVGKGDIVVVSPPGLYEDVLRSPEVEADGGNQQYGQAPPVYSCGLEDSHVENGGFSDTGIRRGFIRKVYLTLCIQLILTIGIIFPFIYWRALRHWVWYNSWFSFTMMATVFVLIMAMSCCDNLRRQVPLNFCALGLFTIAEGLMLGSVAAFFDAEAVGWAVGATALVSLALSLFTLQSKWDFTGVNASLWVFIWTLFSFALLCAILRSQFLYILYACLGTLLFSFYLVFDTQLILGGRHRKYEVSPEEYIFAALNLYLDIVSLFLILLQLIGLCR